MANLDGLLPKAVDEGLRWVAPIGTQMRQASETVALGGATIPAGAPAAAVISSACRDELRYKNPDAFDIRRAKPATRLLVSAAISAPAGGLRSGWS